MKMLVRINNSNESDSRRAMRYLKPASRCRPASPLGFSEAKRAGQAGLKPPSAD